MAAGKGWGEENLAMMDRQMERGQAAFAVAGVRQRDRQPSTNRGKEAPRQTQGSTAVQIPADVG